MAHLHDIVFDCAHPASLARFWAAALDGHAVAPYDADELDLDGEVARLVELGATPVASHDAVVVLRDPEGNEFCVVG